MNMPKKVVWDALTIAVLFSAAILPQYAKADDQVAAAAEKSRVLTAKELDSIYEDRSWPWKEGAAYYGAEHKVFKAWTGRGAKATYAEGSWSVSDQGRLCFHATWHGINGHSSTTTSCLEHRTDEKNIYQRTLPHGKWYIFSHLPAQTGDEIQKLQSGDKISDDYRATQRFVTHYVGKRRRI